MKNHVGLDRKFSHVQEEYVETTNKLIKRKEEERLLERSQDEIDHIALTDKKVIIVSYSNF